MVYRWVRMFHFLKGYLFMILAVPKEILDREHRVAITPGNISTLQKLGYEVQIEAKAGESAAMPDQAYVDQGAVIVNEAEKIWRESPNSCIYNSPKFLKNSSNVMY